MGKVDKGIIILFLWGDTHWSSDRELMSSIGKIAICIIIESRTQLDSKARGLLCFGAKESYLLRGIKHLFRQCQPQGQIDVRSSPEYLDKVLVCMGWESHVG